MALTHSHKWGGFENQKLLFSQFVGKEVWNQGVSGRWSFWPPQASSGFWHLQAYGHISLVSTSVFSMCLCCAPFCLLKGYLSLDLGPSWGIQEDLISKALTSWHLQRSFYQIRAHSHFQGFECRHLFWGQPPFTSLHLLSLLPAHLCFS